MLHVQILVFVSDRTALRDLIRKSEIVPPESSFVSDRGSCSVHTSQQLNLNFVSDRERSKSFPHKFYRSWLVMDLILCIPKRNNLVSNSDRERSENTPSSFRQDDKPSLIVNGVTA